jgi:hypothetical protein
MSTGRTTAPLRATVLVIALLPALLAACTTILTYAEAQATAQATGCWPDFYPTPRAVTVTPAGAPTVEAVPGVPPGTAAPSALPTTTPYPRCAPQPGTTAVAWPSPVPPPPPFPTMERRTWQTGADLQTTLHLPDVVLTIDLATHPTENWPAVASVVWSGTEDPERVFVSVFDPNSGTWSSARQVDTGDSRIGRYSRTVAIAITGDRTVHAVWGMSDPDFSDNDPPSGIWTSSSSDFGQSWSTPQRIATGCKRVNDLAATPDGTLVAQLICDDGPRSTVPAMVIRQPDGAWLQPERLPIPTWYYSEGAVVVTGAGDEARATGVLFAGSGVPTAYIMTRRLAVPNQWVVQALPLHAPAGERLGLRMWHVRGLAYDRPGPVGPLQSAISFTWSDAEHGGAYAMTSANGGATWSAPAPVVPARPPADTIAFVAPAYDPAADRLTAVWTCCAIDDWESHGTTHFGSWAVPGEGRWHLVDTPGQPSTRMPLVLGARSAAQTVSAQAEGSRTAWFAWIEGQQRVEVRSLDLNQLIPVDQYIPAPAGGSS